MINMKNEDYFLSLARRELQELCRRNDLPANKTKSHLAKLLASCYQRKNVDSATFEKRSNSFIDSWPSTAPVLNVESELNSIEKMNEGVDHASIGASEVDCRRSSTCLKVVPVTTMKIWHTDPSINGNKEVYGHSSFDTQQPAGSSPLNSQCDNVDPELKSIDTSEPTEARDYNQSSMYPSRSTGTGNMRQIQCSNMNLCDISTHINVISPDRADKKVVPSFEFYVKRNEGIDLIVDLNSNPSDWIRKLNAGVCIHSEVLNSEPWVLHHELRSLEGINEEEKASSLDDTAIDYKSKGDHTFTNSLLDSTVKKGNHVKDVQPDKYDRSSRAIAVAQTNTEVETSGLVEEGHQLNLSLCGTESDVHDPMTMYIKSSPQSSEKISTSSEVPLTSQIKLTGNHVMSSISDGLKSIDSVDHQSKDGCGNTCQESIKTGFVETLSVPHVKKLPLSTDVRGTIKPFNQIHESASWPFRGCSTSGDSVELQSSEVASVCEDVPILPYHSSGAPNPDNLMFCPQNEVGRSAKCDLDLNTILYSLSECPEEQQKSNLTNETESSECSLFKMKGSNCKRSSSSDSEGLLYKKQHRHSEDNNNFAIKTVTSAKTSARKFLPRRSMRLLPK